MLANKLFAVLCVLFTGISIVSCDSDDGAASAAQTGKFTVTMDGEPYVATKVSATSHVGTYTIKGERGNSGEVITIKVLADTPGTYEAEMRYLDASGEEFSNFTPGSASNGSIKITSLEDNKISGTFNFTAYSLATGSAIDFVDGSFKDVAVTAAEVPVNTGTISAVIDGVQTNFVEAYVATADVMFILSGTETSTSRILQISMPANIAVGTYAIANDATSGIYATIGNDANLITSTEGTLLITGNDNEWLDGTFSFTGQASDGSVVQVTSGQFHAQIQE